MRHNTTWHLIAGIDHWLLHGGSGGSTLILTYAQQHPRRVSEIVIAAATMTRRADIDWLYRGVGRFFPEQWERFLEGSPGTPATETSSPPTPASWNILTRRAGKGHDRLVRLAGIPGVLIHGRLDLGGPLQTAWDLHRAWPNSTLTVIESAGHLGTTATLGHVLRALDRFAVNDAPGG